MFLMNAEIAEIIAPWPFYIAASFRLLPDNIIADAVGVSGALQM